MPKNIVVLSDGTGQDGGKGHDTNIYKLFRMLEDRTDRQVVFYDKGLGTEKQRVSGMAFGWGIGKNIQECYRFIFDNYQAGDKIFLFGFSRGAATVCSLANFIHYFGILPASRPELIQQAYRIYKNRRLPKREETTKSGEAARTTSQQVATRTFKAIDDAIYGWNHRFRDDLDRWDSKSNEFVRLHPNQWVNIEFLGVWDTVPALGLVASPMLSALIDRVPAWKHHYHDFTLKPSVKHAYHALSIDDDRKWFFPTVWKEYEEWQRVEQVWFGGAHTDVGGGFWEAGLSDIALEWMLQKARCHGIRLYFGSRRYWNFCVAPDCTDEYHPPRKGLGRIYASSLRNAIWDAAHDEKLGPLMVHETVLERFKLLGGEKYDPWVLQKGVDRQISEKWLSKMYEAYLYDKELSDARDAYDLWCLQAPQVRLKKQGLLPTLEEWQDDPQYDRLWRTEYTFEHWKRDHVVTDDSGKEFIVERTRKVVLYDENCEPLSLRDYDKDSLADVKAREDYNELRKRVLKIPPELTWWDHLRGRKPGQEVSRIDQDEKRWSGS